MSDVERVRIRLSDEDVADVYENHRPRTKYGEGGVYVRGPRKGQVKPAQLYCVQCSDEFDREWPCEAIALADTCSALAAEVATQDGQLELIREALGEFCRLVGEFDGARPESPAAVFQACLKRVRTMVVEVERLRRQPPDDLATRLAASLITQACLEEALSSAHSQAKQLEAKITAMAQFRGSRPDLA